MRVKRKVFKRVLKNTFVTQREIQTMTKEEVVREYDGKIMVWEKKFMPELVENYKRIKNKDYCDPHFWVIVDVRENGKGNS
jgi:hypothetical protein